MHRIGRTCPIVVLLLHNDRMRIRIYVCVRSPLFLLRWPKTKRLRHLQHRSQTNDISCGDQTPQPQHRSATEGFFAPFPDLGGPNCSAQLAQWVQKDRRKQHVHTRTIHVWSSYLHWGKLDKCMVNVCNSSRQWMVWERSPGAWPHVGSFVRAVAHAGFRRGVGTAVWPGNRVGGGLEINTVCHFNRWSKAGPYIASGLFSEPVRTTVKPVETCR